MITNLVPAAQILILFRGAYCICLVNCLGVIKPFCILLQRFRDLKVLQTSISFLSSVFVFATLIQLVTTKYFL